jgi:signal transduction histidine kinase/ligand-binding sensor protein
MSESTFQAIGHLLDAAAEVIGIPLWIARREDYTPSHRKACPGGVEVPLTLPEAAIVTCRCGSAVLLVPVPFPDAPGITIRSGHIPSGFAWTSGALKVRNLGSPALEWEVPALPVSAALLSTIASCLHEIAASAPDCLAKASNDIAGENVRRICASLAANLEPQPAERHPVAAVRSLFRIPPIERFINRVFRDGRSLASFFQDLTRGLPVSFGLLDLAGTSLVKQRDFCEICIQIRKKDPLRCVLSDLTQVWRAVLAGACEHFGRDFHMYRCPFHFTEAFSPVFAGELAVGAVFGGQLVESEEQRDLIASAATAAVNPEAVLQVSALGSALRLSSSESVDLVRSACRGLAGLTGATFREWCRAEKHSGLRAGLIESASGSNVQKLAEELCPLVVRYLDVTSASIWLLDDDDVVLAATTAAELFVRLHRGAAPKGTRSVELIGSARYKLGEGLTGLVALNRRPMRTENATKEAGWWGKYSETPGDSQFMAVPLLRDQEAFGVLRASKLSDQSPIPDEDYELLKHFAGEVSIAIHEKRLKEELEAKAEGFRLALVETGHEFRSPLQNILGLVAVLNSRLPRDPEVQQVGKRIEEESERAKRQMLNSILFGTSVPLNFRPARLGELLESCASQYESRAAERNIRIIVWDSAKHLPPLSIDLDRMTQVITNLLDNAVKWSFQGERIHIRGEHSDKEVRFSVQDRGTGIPLEYYQAIFEQLFKRKVVDDSKRFVTGTGIGLKIVKRIIDAHYGRIEVSSIPFLSDPNKQSPQYGHTVTFTVTLPKKIN